VQTPPFAPFVFDRGFDVRPLYFQLAENIEQAVKDGFLVSGQRLPAEIKIARAAHVTQSTVRRALSYLEQQGVVHRDGARGTFIS
jgi:DNA-binding GntR family transcriptional regulator